ncbi:hypothetical protein M1563_01735 [Patescibacteria group bacterium]|nr:hypothetical protein [Patescibacteria group bacterium]
MDRIQLLKAHKITVLLISIVVLVVIAAAFFVYKQVIVKSSQQQADLPEKELSFDPEGPYSVLTPRRDGKAMEVNIKRTASFDSIGYELVYNAQGVDRGVTGDINTQDKQGEYNQEVLFGSCSTGGKCVYDEGVENGTLTLHFKQGNQPYRITTQWHLQQPDIALGTLTSGDGHFTYQLDPSKNNLNLIQYSIINDLSGAPKLPSDKQIVGKVYALNVPVAKDLPAGQVTIELPTDAPTGSKIARYTDEDGSWTELDTQVNGSTLKANSPGSGIFTVFATPQS